MWNTGKIQKAWVYDWAIINRTASQTCVFSDDVLLFFTSLVQLCDFKRRMKILSNQRTNKRKEVESV